MTPAVIAITGGGGISPSTRMCFDIVRTISPMAQSKPFLPGIATRQPYIMAMPAMTCEGRRRGARSVGAARGGRVCVASACVASLFARLQVDLADGELERLGARAAPRADLGLDVGVELLDHVRREERKRQHAQHVVRQREVGCDAHGERGGERVMRRVTKFEFREWRRN